MKAKSAFREPRDLGDGFTVVGEIRFLGLSVTTAPGGLE
jgi:hypothetical protein